MLCAIAAQPSAAPQRRSIADRATAIYGVKRLPGEAACTTLNTISLYIIENAPCREGLLAPQGASDTYGQLSDT